MSRKLPMPANVKKLHAAAVAVRKQSYSPYSKFKVGAALRATDGQVFEGCNIENASYGATVCAERTAFLKAVSSGVTRFEDIMVVTEGSTPAYPCALCLQVMAEFCEPTMRIWIADLEGVVDVKRFEELLLKPFGPKQLAEGLK